MVRLSGPLGQRPAANTAVGALYLDTHADTVYQSDGANWSVRKNLDESQVNGHRSGSLSSRPSASAMVGWIWHDPGTGKEYEAFPGGWATIKAAENPSENPALRPLLGEFGVRMSSVTIGDRLADLERTVHLLTTNGVTEKTPALLNIHQIVDVAFVGADAHFDLIEKDATDCDVLFLNASTEEDSPLLVTEDDVFSEGDVGRMIHCPGFTAMATIISVESPNQATISEDCTETATGVTFMLCGGMGVTLGTKTGFEDGITTGNWSQLCRLITSNKSYYVKFVPGSAGAGAYSIKMKELV